MLRDSQVTVNTDQEEPRVTLRNKRYINSFIMKQTLSRLAPPQRTRSPAHRQPLFVSLEIYIYFLSFLAIYRTPTTHRRTFSHHAYTSLVYINPCRARTLQVKVTTVPHTRVACCAKTVSHSFEMIAGSSFTTDRAPEDGISS